MNSYGQFGKWLIFAGLLMCLLGAAVLLLDKTGLFRLPGDLNLEGKNWKVFFPITSCVILSAVMTLLMWIISRFMK